MGFLKKLKKQAKRAQRQFKSNVKGAKRIPASAVKTVASAASPITGIVTRPIKFILLGIALLIALPFIIRAISKSRKGAAS